MPPKKIHVKILKSAITDYNNQANKCQVIINSNKLDKYSPIQSNLKTSLMHYTRLGNHIRKMFLRRAIQKKTSMLKRKMVLALYLCTMMVGRRRETTVFTFSLVN